MNRREEDAYRSITVVLPTFGAKLLPGSTLTTQRRCAT